MLNTVKNKAKGSYYLSGAAMTVGMMGISGSANAQVNNDFTAISQDIAQASAGLPNMIASVSYIVGSLLGVLGVMKIKDHVEKPDNIPLKDGAIRLTAGGALFALPVVTEAMQGSVLGDGGAGVDQAQAAIAATDVDGAFFSDTPNN